MRTLLAAVIASFALTLACAPPPPNPDDYDDSCVVADDCVGIYVGDPCGECQCANDAIASSASDDWYAAQPEPFCFGDLPGFGFECLCAAPMLVCEDGRCTIGG